MSLRAQSRYVHRKQQLALMQLARHESRVSNNDDEIAYFKALKN